MASEKMLEKCKQNKTHYESTVEVGKSLYVFLLQTHYKDDPEMSDLKSVSKTKLKKDFNKDELILLEQGIHIYRLDSLDVSMLHKLVFHLCGLEKKASPAPQLQNDLRILKDSRNEIAHITDITEFKDLFIWKKIIELRVLFEKILQGIKDVYQTAIQTDVIDKTNKDMNDAIDKILKDFAITVGDLEVGSLLMELQTVEQCPFKVKIEIKENPDEVPSLLPLLQRISQANEKTNVSLMINKSYFDGQFYDSEKYLTPLLDENSKCKLTWYRGNLSNQMISKLPETLKQLYIRMRVDQVKHLKEQLPKLPDLWSLGLYLDFTEKDNCYGFENIDLSSLPQLDYKGKQLGLRFCGSIVADNITLVVQVIKKLTTKHQCDTLEFYQTHLDTAEDIESLLQELHTSGIHVTTWVKLQNHAYMKDSEQEKHLNNLAKSLNLKTFMFMNPCAN